ncbi:hypothetical protein PHYPSEUDO_008076 [Phytophthora pseudosyringae]|uniref:Uncharacterized protein n=1 Tax=Phytophthora pseudosyringae TaxID=221518 RepID=A0A8T1VI20_9STRA|nr:hypothetical protein PHYPSEUDO_008076 [Phytophthora pseudosyringae]
MLLLTHAGGCVSTTSSVVFYPFVASFPPLFTTALATGEGLSGSLAALLGVVQDPGGARRFSVTAFYLLCAVFMCVSLAAFAFLRCHPWAEAAKASSQVPELSIQKGKQLELELQDEREAEQDTLLTGGGGPSANTATGTRSGAAVFRQVWPLLACQFVLAAFSFGWLPSTMPYVYKKFAPPEDAETTTARLQTTASIAALILSPLASVATTWFQLYYVRSMSFVLLALASLLLSFSLTSKPVLSGSKHGYVLRKSLRGVTLGTSLGVDFSFGIDKLAGTGWYPALLVHVSYLVGCAYTQTMLYLTLKRAGGG